MCSTRNDRKPDGSWFAPKDFGGSFVRFLWITGFLWDLSLLVHGGVVLRLDPPLHIVEPNQPFDLRVRIDSDSERPGDQGFAEGLFSYGFRVTVDPNDAVPSEEADAVMVPDALDFTGFRSGATMELESGVVVVKGNVNPGNPDRMSYVNPLIATIRLVNRAVAGTVYPLTLELYRLFPSEDVFLTETGRKLDDELDTVGTVVSVSGRPAIPLNITRVPTSPPGSVPRVTISFPILDGFDHWVERTDSLGRAAEWVVLPAGPHNSRPVTDDAGEATRFYRLRVLPR